MITPGSPKSILNAAFKYTPSHLSDIRKRFDAIRKQQVDTKTHYPILAYRASENERRRLIRDHANDPRT